MLMQHNALSSVLSHAVVPQSQNHCPQKYLKPSWKSLTQEALIPFVVAHLLSCLLFQAMQDMTPMHDNPVVVLHTAALEG